MRKPSIHIDIDTFSSILEKLGKVDSSNLEEFFVLARRKPLNNRSITISNDKLKKEAIRICQSSKGDAFIMADIIYASRIKLKHRGIKKIKPDSREWLQLKELTKLANQFCKDFDLPTREGFIKYIEIGFSKISSFRVYLSKLISMYEVICREYEAMLNMNEDDDKEATLELHNIFVNTIADKTGLYERYDNKPDKMVAFYKARLLADELGVDYDTFIEAQFEALDWCNGIPAPDSLYGDKAKERLNKYLYQNHISLETKSKKSFWESLKNKSYD